MGQGMIDNISFNLRMMYKLFLLLLLGVSLLC
jgi:hypothetical protein